MSPLYQTIIKQMTTEDKIELLHGKGLWRTAGFEHFGIEDVAMTDGTYGVRYNRDQVEKGADWSISDFLSVVGQQADELNGTESYFGLSEPATCFPNGSSVGCSWDTDLMYQMGKALAAECRHYGIDLLLGPGINIRRTPLAGRGYEYYAEDPVVSGDLAASLINGMQDHGVGASLKHFAANNSEFKRTEMNSVVDERALHEIYLAGFKRAIDKSSPWTVMSSYNRLNGVQTSQNKWLLTDVLREHWQYDGLVISDWYGVKDRPASLIAGNDLAMPESFRDKAALRQAIEQNRVSDDELNRSCQRVLEFVDKAVKGRELSQPVDFMANHQLAQRIAAESIVLLKNSEQILPIDCERVSKILVVGDAAQVPVIQGSGCATTRPYLLDCPLDEIIDIADEHFTIDYVNGTESDEQRLRAVDSASHADLVILFASTEVGKDGENGDRANLDIIASHQRLIESISEVQSELVVVLANSDAVVMPWISKAKAVLETFFSGQGMGRAVAEILFGHQNPSGKLTVTVPNSLEETPAYLSYPGENGNHHYSEGLFVGYRYYDKRRIKPLFPFGFGLSYTSFELSDLHLSREEIRQDCSQGVKVKVTVTNTGAREGKEVVQVYLSAPQKEYAREVKSLKAFKKVALKPGESRVVELDLEWQDFCYFNPQVKSWLAEKGDHQIWVGNASDSTPLCTSVFVLPHEYFAPLRIDSTLVDLLNNPTATDRVATLISQKSVFSPQQVKDKLASISEDMFCGMAIAFNEMLGIAVSDSELQDVLDQS